MQLTPLTFKSIRTRAVVLKLKRPVVARIATITDWPLILIDLLTEEGIVGRSYLALHHQDDEISGPRRCKRSVPRPLSNAALKTPSVSSGLFKDVAE